MRQSLKEYILDRVDKNAATGCWEWTKCRSAYGYGRVTFSGRVWQAHRLSYHAHIGPIPDEMCLCHTCDNPPCCNPDHLFLGTKADNARDRAAKGRSNRPAGERNPRSKLTVDVVRDIRRLYASGGVVMREIGIRYGIGTPQVCSIINKKSWAHV